MARTFTSTSGTGPTFATDPSGLTNLCDKGRPPDFPKWARVRMIIAKPLKRRGQSEIEQKLTIRVCKKFCAEVC
jgi:hypothetical protein